MTDDHRDARVRAADQAVGRRNRSEDVVRFQRVVTEVIQLTGENIEEDFGIRGGIDMAAFFFKQLFTQLVRIGQVAVMRQCDAIRRVNVKRLRLGGAGAARRRITHVANTHIALHTLHVAGFEYVAYQPVSLTQPEAVVGINGDDASGILSTVLEHR
ncbi:Uncharacterised protein [Klebsiella aerogenes]|nr:Uncharacterised protein [Klebsiella aerogenes]